MKVYSVLRRVYVMRIYCSMSKDLKFDWSIQVTWKQRAYSLVQQHESWQIFQLLSFLVPVVAGGLLKQIIVLFWITIVKISVLKTRDNSEEFVFKQPIIFFNKRLRHRCLLVNFAKLNTIYTDRLGTPASIFLNKFVISQVLICQLAFPMRQS